MPHLSPSENFANGADLAIGVDIGGTKIAAGVVDGTGAIVRSVRTPTPAGDAAAIEREVVRLVRSLDAASIPVGIAAAGFIDANQAEVMYAPNIDWRNVPLRAQLESQLGCSVTVDNDANAAGWAEYRFGAGRGVQHMTMLTVGTGVGGAVVVDGRLLRGGFGAAGELGHVRLVPDGHPCGCGQRGCLEQYGSGRALMRRLTAIADEPERGRALAAARAADGELNATNVGPLILAGDPGALAALTEVGMALGAGCASLAAVLDPECFVIGGGVAIAGDALLEPIRVGFASALPARGFRPEPEFHIAQLGNDAGLVGAADLARTYLHSQSVGK